MTAVVRGLFKDSIGSGSLDRPDFVVMPDSSVGFYARSSFDDEYNENGRAHVVIVDLKTTRLPFARIPNMILSLFAQNDGFSVCTGRCKERHPHSWLIIEKS